MRQPAAKPIIVSVACLLLVLHVGAQAAPDALPAAAAPAASASTVAPPPGAPAVEAQAGAMGNPGDAILHLLQDKLLLPKPYDLKARLDASPVVQQMRDTASDLVLSAMNFLGVRYRRGGNSAETGFDCSGFTRYVFENSIGLVLPRRADQQSQEQPAGSPGQFPLAPGKRMLRGSIRFGLACCGNRGQIA
jgi:cell wall-associated NlpC family hydrolase